MEGAEIMNQRQEARKKRIQEISEYLNLVIVTVGMLASVMLMTTPMAYLGISYYWILYLTRLLLGAMAGAYLGVVFGPVIKTVPMKTITVLIFVGSALYQFLLSGPKGVLLVAVAVAAFLAVGGTSIYARILEKRKLVDVTLYTVIVEIMVALSGAVLYLAVIGA